MSDQLRLYTKALYGFDHVARQAGPADWERPSPCAGWTARHVIGHVIAVQRYLEGLIRDVPATMNPMKAPDRHAGDDPYATWAATRDAILEAVDHPGVLHRVVHGWRGPSSVDDLLGGNVGDTTIHTWDLARALGVDDRLDADQVARVLAELEVMGDEMRTPMVFGPAVEVPTGATDQERMLALAGRSPR